ncbi:MAG: Holliday junction resolvase RuvX [Mailhella sp.]|nr:Holliday junction resolvase RuvX [Mailhella sp.]
MKYLAIDYGLKRCGIAVSDSGGTFAFPLRTLERKTKAQFFEELLRLIDEEQAGAIIVGLPLHTDGTECLMTTQTRHFVQSLKRRTALPVYWMSEILSSTEAEGELAGMGLSPAKVKKVVDQQAAVLILESFINQPAGRRVLA